jgi:hypothetical protein
VPDWKTAIPLPAKPNTTRRFGTLATPRTRFDVTSPMEALLEAPGLAGFALLILTLFWGHHRGLVDTLMFGLFFLAFGGYSLRYALDPQRLPFEESDAWTPPSYLPWWARALRILALLSLALAAFLLITLDPGNVTLRLAVGAYLGVGLVLPLFFREKLDASYFLCRDQKRLEYSWSFGILGSTREVCDFAAIEAAIAWPRLELEGPERRWSYPVYLIFRDRPPLRISDAFVERHEAVRVARRAAALTGAPVVTPEEGEAFVPEPEKGQLALLRLPGREVHHEDLLYDPPSPRPGLPLALPDLEAVKPSALQDGSLSFEELMEGEGRSIDEFVEMFLREMEEEERRKQEGEG